MMATSGLRQTQIDRTAASDQAENYEGPFVVGKDVLELLSSSMHVNPLAIYREYVQNAADSIDEAVEAGALANVSKGRIDIVLDHIERRAVIRDNGIGLSEDEFAQMMTSFGASHKRGTTARGFRGVGRLAGLGYCQQLRFRSRSTKEANILEVRWDCRLLKSLLSSPNFDGDLEELVRKIVSVRKIDNDGYPERFFEVEIERPRRLATDRLLNELEIEAYLAQVGPCPLDPQFSFGGEIKEILHPLGSASREYNIHLNENDTPICRPYSDKIPYSDARTGHARDVREITIDGADGELAAAGWILHHDYQGAIPSNLGIKGLRARVGNIQVGNERIFSNVFPEERFCSWTVGELHLVDTRILPNGRRDDFEPNSHLSNVVTHLIPYGSEVARHCRKSSKIRNRKKVFELGEQKILQKIGIIEQGATSKAVAATLRREVGTHLAEIRHAVIFDLIDNDDRAQLDARASELEKLANKQTQRKNSDDPLLVFPKSKQKAYREVFDLIYECSVNGNAAKSLIDRILNRISKS